MTTLGRVTAALNQLAASRRTLATLPDVRNYLYEHPELYERVYPEPNDETPAMCRRFFERYLGKKPKSILDIGCGTGRDLHSLARDGGEAVGIDALPQMIDLARSRYPEHVFQVGDMRSVRLGRTFDVILCMGSALMYAKSDADIRTTFATFAAHATAGSLLILDINNAASCLPGGKFQTATSVEVNLPEFQARGASTYSFDRRKQLMLRRRQWTFSNGATADDYCEYRMFFPAELDHLLSEHGFQTLGMFDNMQLAETDLSGLRLYLAAQYTR